MQPARTMSKATTRRSADARNNSFVLVLGFRVLILSGVTDIPAASPTSGLIVEAGNDARDHGNGHDSDPHNVQQRTFADRVASWKALHR